MRHKSQVIFDALRNIFNKLIFWKLSFEIQFSLDFLGMLAYLIAHFIQYPAPNIAQRVMKVK